MGALFPFPMPQAIASGGPLSGAKLYTYAAGTSTPLATTDADGATNANPVIADANGYFNVRFDGSKLYKLVLTTAAGATIWSQDNVGLTADGLSYIQSESGAVRRDGQGGLRQVLYVDDFIPVGTDTEATDVSAYVQNALNAINATAYGGVLRFGRNKFYRCDDALTCVSSIQGVSRSKMVRIIEGNGATLDFRNCGITDNYLNDEQTAMLTVGTQVNTGAPSNPLCQVEEGLVAIRDLRFMGPEPMPDFSGPNPGVDLPETGTIGIRFQLANDVAMDNVLLTGFTVGVETKDSWGLNFTRVLVRNSWVGWNVSGGSTYTNFTQCGAVQCNYTWLFRASTKSISPFYGAFAAISQQHLTNCRFEYAWYGPIIFPHDTDIRGIVIDGGYVENIARDFIVSGFQFNQADIDDPGSTLSAAAGNEVDRLSVRLGGKFQWGSSGAGFYAFKGPTGSLKNVHCDLTLACLSTDVSCAFGSSSVRFLGSDTGNAGAISATDTSGNTSFSFDLHNGGVQLSNTDNTDPNVLDYYKESQTGGSATTVTLTGVSGTVTGTLHWTRIGNEVTLDVPALTGTSNATTKTITGIPSILRPATQKTGVCLTSDNGGAYVAAQFNVKTDDTIELFASANGAAFTGSGAYANRPFSFSYTLK